MQHTRALERGLAKAVMAELCELAFRPFPGIPVVQMTAFRNYRAAVAGREGEFEVTFQALPKRTF